MARRNIIVFGLIALFLAISVYVTQNHSISSADVGQGSWIVEDTEGDGPVDTGSSSREKEKAIGFSVTNPSGEEVALSDYRGKFVYLNFWATWCKWCTAEMPDIQKVYDEYANDGLVVVAVNVGEDADKAAAYMNERGYTFDILLDKDKEVIRGYGFRSIPVSILIDKEGFISYKKVGYMTEDEIREAVQRLIANG